MNSNGSLLRSSLALLAGIATDIICSLGSGIALGILIGIVLVLRRVPPPEMAEQLDGPSMLIVGSILGYSFSMLGGYVAARLARRSELLHGGLNAGLATLIAWALPIASSHSIPVRIVLSLVTIPFGVLGGWIALAQRRRSDRRQAERVRAYFEEEARHEAAAEAERSGYRSADRDNEL